MKSSLLKELWADKSAFFAAVFLVLLVVAAVFAPLVAPYGAGEQSLSNRLQPPFWMDGASSSHPLGTDNLGRDVLSRMIYGARTSLMIGVLVVLFAAAIGVTLGLVGGYKGGRLDAIIMRAADIQVSFPGILLAITVLAVIGASAKTVVIILGLNGWMIFARVTRSTVLAVKETPYVEAAEIVGCRPRRVVFRHILPNLVPPLLTLFILEFARIILTEAALSFLGVGVQPPQTSWGLDIAIGRDYLFNAWWLVTFPGIAIALTVLAVNLVASWAQLITNPIEREKFFAARQVHRLTNSGVN